MGGRCKQGHPHSKQSLSHKTEYSPASDNIVIMLVIFPNALVTTYLIRMSHGGAEQMIMLVHTHPEFHAVKSFTEMHQCSDAKWLMKLSLFQRVKGKRDFYLRFRSVIDYTGYTGWSDLFYIKEHIMKWTICHHSPICRSKSVFPKNITLFHILKKSLFFIL